MSHIKKDKNLVYLLAASDTESNSNVLIPLNEGQLASPGKENFWLQCGVKTSN